MIPFYATGFEVCETSLNLAFEKQEFAYEFKFTIEALKYNSKLLDFFTKYWQDARKLNQLQTNFDRHTITKIKSWIEANNSGFFVLECTLLLIIVICKFSFFVYYLKINIKVIYFYRLLCLRVRRHRAPPHPNTTSVQEAPATTEEIKIDNTNKSIVYTVAKFSKDLCATAAKPKNSQGLYPDAVTDSEDYE